MKQTLITSAILMLSISFAGARTWTSSDGSKTFEGELRSYDPDSGSVTVLINGRAVNFQQDKLSEEDIAFLKESGTKTEAAASAPDPDTEIGAKVLKARLKKLDGKRYKSAEVEKAPKYYVLYYSASW